ncbi:probable sugar phosphate/phosphate translocator At1g06470 [Pistacia vera]|uniref:probable sugar phosphate/phosphate translocator At1g06470 n=1 Tax=Pistacia vera TaxID=55513 RepID=UPI001263682F|nr:probable sugar phosphate/phosphate translocator At1g06470 [Pistacia vera]
MVEGILDPEKVENITEVYYIDSANQASLLPREPSFSGWCEEHDLPHMHRQLQNSEASVEDSDFELPSLQEGELEKRMKLNGGNTMVDDSVLDKRSGDEKYVPFDIENGSVREISLSNIGVDGPRSSGDNGTLPPHSRSYVSAADVLKTLFFILMWYTFSTFLTLYNKTLLGDDMGKFPAPLLMNTVHFTMQAVLSKAITWFWSHRFQPSVAMSWRDYLFRVVPTALATALDVNLSNASLVFISVTFATMCKSAAPIFLILFAFAFRLESPSFKLLGITVVISVGILLTVAKETDFEFWGFIFVMLAAVMSGFRWCMTQILLQKEAYGLKNPLTLMSYLTPVMAVVTALLSLFLDPWHEFRENNYFNNSWHVTRSCLLMLFGGTLAFFMVLTEYVLVSVTSAVTVTIAGVVKESVTILVAVFYFHDKFTWLKGIGLFTIMVGVSLFNWFKYQKLKKGHASEDDILSSPTANVSAKYVILEEVDDLDEGWCYEEKLVAGVNAKLVYICTPPLFFFEVWALGGSLLKFIAVLKHYNAPNKKLSVLICSFLSLQTLVAKETDFEFWGFIFVMLAAVMSGFRWCMTQILLQKEAYGLKNPLTLMSYLTPVMAVVTALLSLFLDPWHEFRENNYFNNSWHVTRSCLLMLFGGTLAFFMVLTEYVLVSVTSAVTVTIAGVVKESVTILVAVFYFHDKFTWLKGIGLFTIMVGVSLFNWFKYQKLKKGHASEDDILSSPTANVSAKYVILEEVDDLDEGT